MQKLVLPQASCREGIWFVRGDRARLPSCSSPALRKDAPAIAHQFLHFLTVMLAVPYTVAASVVADYGGALDGKVIIDITNTVSPDLTRLVSPAGSSGAQEIARVAPASAHVVKAFNTLFGHVLAKRGRLDTFIESLGLRPLDVGGLHMAHTLEALGLMMIGLAKNGAGTWDIALSVN
ncbi:NADPH-dependent F420 reductase [Pseudomonas gingeri]